MDLKIKIAIWSSFLFISVAAGQGQALDTPASSTGDIHFYVDYAGFMGNDGKTYEEIYLMLYADQLSYTWRDQQQIASYEVTILLEQPGTSTTVEKSWTTDAAIAHDSTDLKKLAIYDLWAGELPPGNYRLQVHVADLNAAKVGHAELSMIVAEFKDGALSASQIEFAVHAEAVKTNKHFVKGHRTIIPNPARRYGLLNSTLYLYYELYNLSRDIGNKLTVAYSIRQQDGGIVKSFPKKETSIPGSNASILHGFDVSQVPSGIYELVVQIADTDGDTLLQFSRDFEIIQLDYFDSQPTLTAENAKRAGKMLKHLASSDQYQLYQKLNLAGKAQFLVRFWRDRDPTPETVENEFLQQVHKRFTYANEHFGWGKTEGWESDRGRVLIQNGMPDEIERHANEADSNPYEVWIYHQDRSYHFVFGELRSGGRYALLHSNKEDEVHNPHWTELLKRY